MRFLLDTNVLIPAEPTSGEHVEATTSSIVRLLQLLSRGGHSVNVHPASVREVRADKNVERANLRSTLLLKYPELPHPPPQSTRLTSVLGIPREGTNNEIDLLILSAVEGDAVDYLVTEDDGIHRRARRTGLEGRVLTITDAVLLVGALFPSLPEAPPHVVPVLAHQLDASDAIFESFRADYPGFDDWLIKCKREHRQAWVIPSGQSYAGVCIVNPETTGVYGLHGKILKICSFKIAPEYRGYRYGELLLKTVFMYLLENGYRGTFVEVLPRHQELFDLLTDFGFADIGESSKDERIFFKKLQPEPTDIDHVSPLEFNIKYGPYALTLMQASAFVVPIQPQYHAALFPELEPQLSLATESHPFGNSIRKAYLCHSNVRKIRGGDVLLFYRSKDHQGISAIGVAETTLVSPNPSEIAHYVGRRTVYSYEEIKEMATKPVLAILFRFARGLKKPWNVDLLTNNGIITRAPQSIMQVEGRAIAWIATQLDVPS